MTDYTTIALVSRGNHSYRWGYTYITMQWTKEVIVDIKLSMYVALGAMRCSQNLNKCGISRISNSMIMGYGLHLPWERLVSGCALD